jgi:hypothetical protein
VRVGGSSRNGNLEIPTLVQKMGRIKTDVFSAGNNIIAKAWEPAESNWRSRYCP